MSSPHTNLRHHTTSTDLSLPGVDDDKSNSAGDDNSVVQLNISPTAWQLGLPTSPGLLIISSAVRDVMDKVMAPVAKNISLLAESLHLLTGASGSSSSRCGGHAISTTMPPSVRLRVGGQMARSPSPDFQGGDHRRIAPSAPRVVADTAYLVAASAREHLLQEGHTDNVDAVSLQASDHDLSDTPRDNFTKFKEKFSNKELTGKPLLSTAADCFNLVYHEMTTPLLFSKRNSALRM